MLYRTLDPRRTLEALHQPSYRWWLVERMVGASTWAMRTVGRGWLVYHLTGSVLALAWVEAVRFIVGILVSPVAGVICDRIEKRLVMFGCRFLLIFTNLALALLLFFGAIELWHIVAVTIAEALIYSVMEPALMSILPEIVGRDLLLSATSTMFVVEGVLNILGAAAAGVVIEAAGAGWVFLANAPALCACRLRPVAHGQDVCRRQHRIAALRLHRRPALPARQPGADGAAGACLCSPDVCAAL